MLFIKKNKKFILAALIGLGAGLASFAGDPSIAGLVEKLGNAILSMFGV
jgi:hypothetical protein